jgi:hypothetical protein
LSQGDTLRQNGAIAMILTTTIVPKRNAMTYALDLVETVEQLQELHTLDSEAYQETAIEFATFEQWWKTYDLGLRIALDGDRIVGRNRLLGVG